MEIKSKLLDENHKRKLINVDNMFGGATFKLIIPIVVNSLFDENVVEQDIIALDLDDSTGHETSRFKSCRILLVEENVELLNFVYELLRGYFIVVKAKSRREALDLLARNTFEVIVSDMVMPDIKEFGLSYKVKSDPNTSCFREVLYTEKATMDSCNEGSEDGVNVSVEKPSSVKFLKMQIENLLKLRLSFQRMIRGVASQVPIDNCMSTKDKDFLSKLQREIDKHIIESDFSITSLTEMMIMSRSYFYRKIKEVTGLTPNEYLKITRLNKAAELLRQDDVRIGDVYEQVGFSSSSYFAKCFNAHFGLLPKAYMKTVGREGYGAEKHID